MSSTAVVHKKGGLNTRPEAQLQWPTLFPANATATYDCSSVFVKQLTIVAVSTITYLRNLLPECCYTVERLGKNDIRVLKGETDDPLGTFLSRALTHAFEAFDKKFLNELVLCFFEGECKPGNLIEYYKLQYDYHDGDTSVTLDTKGGTTRINCDMENLKIRTKMLIKSCMMATPQSTLPKHLDVSIRLIYNENAPRGYQAPGYNDASYFDARAFNMFDTIKIGSVRSPYHYVRLLGMISFKPDSASHEALASLTNPDMTPSQNVCVERPNDAEATTSNARGVLKESVANNCVCQLTDRDWQTITCYYCKTQQHAVCYGVRAPDIKRFARHCCADCAETYPSHATDIQFHEKPKNRTTRALYRRGLEWCCSLKCVSIQDVMMELAMEEHMAIKFISVLHNLGVVVQIPENTNVRVKISRKDLKCQIDKHFLSFDDDDIVDRILDEHNASQEQHGDPIAHVLGPMRQVSLQNKSQIVRVITPLQEINNNEDPTLTKYKEALNLMDTNDMELSLSPLDLQNAGKKRKNTHCGDAVAPKRSLKKAPKTNPKEAPKINPKKATKTNPKEAPKINQKEAPKINPKKAPKINPNDAPKTNPKEAPKISPKVAPKINPKVSPKRAKRNDNKLSLVKNRK